jgi:fumarate hydratase subunit beta
MNDGLIKLNTPLDSETIRNLRSGDKVSLSGIVYTSRDAAHRKMMETLDRGESLPIPSEGSVIYYVGPTPPRPGKPIGSAGPTTSGRMDSYAPRLMRLGYKVMIGKGARSPEVKEAIVETGSVYLAAIGGAGALAAKSIVEAEVVAYPELGPEAIHKLRVVEFPLVVVNDSVGGDLYEQGKARFRRILD